MNSKKPTNKGKKIKEKRKKEKKKKGKEKEIICKRIHKQFTNYLYKGNHKQII